MSIELRIVDDDMMDLSVPEDAEQEDELLPPVDAPTAEKAAESADAVDEPDLLAKQKQLRQLYGIPHDLERKLCLYSVTRLFIGIVHSVEEVV